MTERPIIFSTPMVKALIDGRKTQTRRILKPQPAKWEARVIDITPPFFNEEEGGWGQVETIWSGPLIPGMCEPEREEWRPLRLRYAVGDRLWVRETWAPVFDNAWRQSDVIYRADGNEGWKHGWRPSIHMPRWASRITLEVTKVRVQRLQEISEEDAKAEGVRRKEGGYLPGTRGDYIGTYAALWNSLHGPDAWAANPWVAAINFKRVQP